VQHSQQNTDEVEQVSFSNEKMSVSTCLPPRGALKAVYWKSTLLRIIGFFLKAAAVDIEICSMGEKTMARSCDVNISCHCGPTRRPKKPVLEILMESS
jgi:ABC-type Na+ transport system ATPase subunit NatA